MSVTTRVALQLAMIDLNGAEGAVDDARIELLAEGYAPLSLRAYDLQRDVVARRRRVRELLRDYTQADAV